ncbi:LysR family transcriptional regulator [Reyranella sp. CPCC 100927]|uniref:LysR family transcriptional regulator n=1 Tax=Reyranella sp. CPCC 100927 TaxID=2599616 RepID=UPI0011B55BF5|nr:LysR family transcriptional regulator [Reyranella sp. CPCC 100927]TWT05942.1 LysR family transcriptional regulator [Reyranella sp. CPCC 100927]
MNDDDIGLRHLRILALLLEVRSLTRAAIILGTTQSSISKTLGKLRAHFSDPLLVRVGLAMQPTPKAIALVQPLQALLATSDTMRSTARAFDPASARREFSLLVTEVGMVRFVPPLISHLERTGHGLRLRAVPLDSREFGARLEAGEADVAIGVFPAAAPTIRRQRLYIDKYVSVVRGGHPRREKLVRADAFLRERHVMVTSSHTGHAAHRMIEQAFADALDADRVLVRMPSFITAAFVASRTDAVASMPARLADYLMKDLDLAVFRTPIDLPRLDISQFWHERFHHDRGHRWFRAAIHDLFGAS